METIENGLRGIDTDPVNGLMLFVMVIIFISGLYFTHKNKQSAFVQYVPTLLTSLGIFGTFLGIVVGLLAFDQLEIEKSIPPLLDGLKTAFITSLAGIFLSLIFKTITSFAFLKPKKAKVSVSQATPEAILDAMQAQVLETKQLKNALVGNEESTLFGQLKILRGDINDNAKFLLKNTQEQAVNQQAVFEGFSEKLWLKLQDFADTLSKSATEQVIEALKQVINDFNHNLTEQFGDNFKQLNEAVHKLVDWQENYKNQLERMQLQYEQSVQSIHATELSIAHISEHSRAIPDYMDKLKSVMEVNQHQLQELERHLDVFKQMRDKAVAAIPQIQQHVEAVISDIASAVSTASDHYKLLLSDSDDYIKTHAEISNELLDKFANETEKGITRIGERLIESSAQISNNIDTAANAFSDNTARTNQSLQTSSDHLQSQTEVIKQHLHDAVSEINNTLRNMIETLVIDATEMTSSMKQANQHLITDTEQVRDSVVKSADKLQQRLNEVIDEAATQQIDQAKRTFNAMEEQIKQQVGFTGEMVDEQLKLIDTAMQKEIERIMNEMGQALTQVSGRFVKDYTRLTEAMSDVINQQVA